MSLWTKNRSKSLTGFNITAFVRTPSRVPAKLQKDIAIIQGDVLDKQAVEKAIQGHNVVLSALGTGWALGKTTLISEGCKNIVAGMKKHGVRKLAVVGVNSLLPGQWKPWILKDLIDDHQRQIDILEKESDSIDWLALMPPSLWKSSYISSTYTVEKGDFTGRWWVSTGEMTDFMIKCFRDENLLQEYRHQLVGISSGPAIISSFQLKILAVISVALGMYALLLWK